MRIEIETEWYDEEDYIQVNRTLMVYPLTPGELRIMLPPPVSFSRDSRSYTVVVIYTPEQGERTISLESEGNTWIRPTLMHETRMWSEIRFLPLLWKRRGRSVIYDWVTPAKPWALRYRIQDAQHDILSLVQQKLATLRETDIDDYPGFVRDQLDELDREMVLWALGGPLFVEEIKP